MKTIHFLFAAGLMLALAFIFSCSSDDGGGNREGTVSSSSSDIYSSSSSSVEVSSSSQADDSSSSQSDKSSSSNAVREYGYCVFISDKICLIGPMSDCPSGGTLSNSCPYSSSSITPSSSSVAPNCNLNGGTVKIGGQIWMAENLNCNVSGSKCYGEGGEVSIDGSGSPYKTLSNAEIQANCDKYGRLYDWATAMALPSNCNDISCSSRISTKHKGICPSGWHIPSDDEWAALFDYAGDAGSYKIAVRKLKATSGWDGYYYDRDYNGLDSYGFAALPGGYRGWSPIDSVFLEAGKLGAWWSSTEHDNSDDYANSATMDNEGGGGYKSGQKKKDLISIRCLQDNSVSNIPSSSSCSLNGGTVTIGNQVWMAENLNCDVRGSKCYDNDPENCTKYGRLYNWATAMALPSYCNYAHCSSLIGNKHRGICPSGWHIPNNTEWNALITAVGTSTARSKLRAINDWDCSDATATDDYGFSALPGGDGRVNSNFYDVDDYYDFSKVGQKGGWWSANELDHHALTGDANNLHIDCCRDCGSIEIMDGYQTNDKENLSSVRCLKD